MTTSGIAAAERVHVIGAGLAGLAAAVDLAANGIAVSIHEAGPQAGGRCRSFLDPELGVRIDNGNHLLLSGNDAALAYIERIGSRATFESPATAAIPFVDLSDGDRWLLRPGAGPLPWWLLRRSRRVPGTRLRDYLGALRLRRAGPHKTVAGVLASSGLLYRRFWEPLTVAALNTPAAEASAQLLWRVVRETLGRGAAACRPLVARDGLSESLVDPALAFLAQHGAAIRFGARLKAIRFGTRRVAALSFDDGVITLGPRDSVVLAIPAAVAARLVPGLVVPDRYGPIVNAHFRFAAPSSVPLVCGIVGGTAEWVFRKHDVVSVTVSAAERIVGCDADELRDRLWRDVALAFGLAANPVPPARIVKERRATFLASPEQLRRRPDTATAWANFHLAGDYVDTGLPATIEAAIRSGLAAAACIRGARTLQPAMAPAMAPLPAPGVAAAIPAPTDLEDCQRALP